MSYRAVVIIAMFLAAAPVLGAQTPSEPPARRTELAQRIRTGIQSAQLTRNEAARIRTRMAAHRQRAAAMRASDAVLSATERQTIRRGWRGVSRQIFRLRHNGVHRGR